MSGTVSDLYSWLLHDILLGGIDGDLRRTRAQVLAACDRSGEAWRCDSNELRVFHSGARQRRC